MKTIKKYLNREFSVEERTAIGELIKMAELMVNEDGSPISDIHGGIGALFLERAANIIRQETIPATVDMECIQGFAHFWKINHRAKFNEVKNAKTK